MSSNGSSLNPGGKKPPSGPPISHPPHSRSFSASLSGGRVGTSPSGAQASASDQGVSLMIVSEIRCSRCRLASQSSRATSVSTFGSTRTPSRSQVPSSNACSQPGRNSPSGGSTSATAPVPEHPCKLCKLLSKRLFFAEIARWLFTFFRRRRLHAVIAPPQVRGSSARRLLSVGRYRNETPRVDVRPRGASPRARARARACLHARPPGPRRASIFSARQRRLGRAVENLSRERHKKQLHPTGGSRRPAVLPGSLLHGAHEGNLGR